MVITKKQQFILAGSVIVVLFISFWWRLSQLQTDLNFVKQITIPVPASANLPAANPTPVVIESDEELTTVLTDLQASISALQLRLKSLEATKSSVSSPGPSPTAVNSTQTVFQPQNIYLGAASTTNTDWVNTNVEVKINSADYPADVHAVFEAGLSIVSGEVWARLKNTTTGAILSVTEIFHNSATSTWKNSGNWQLHSGSNLYVVQLKSSGGETANLSSARIRISR